MKNYIIPKICEYDSIVKPEIGIQINRTAACEIQLMQSDFMKSIPNIEKILESNYMRYLVLHLPFQAFYIDMICSSIFHKNRFIEFIDSCIELSDKYGIAIDIQAHVNLNPAMFVLVGAMDFLDFILLKLKYTKVGILIENSIISLNEDDGNESTEAFIFRNLDNEHLNFCFDLCHWQASENVLRKTLEIPEILLKKMRNIHFSATLDNDGYCNKQKTHGRAHLSDNHMIEDIKYLENKGINLDIINLIAEINEDDYTNRPDLIGEIKRFNWLVIEEAI